MGYYGLGLKVMGDIYRYFLHYDFSGKTKQMQFGWNRFSIHSISFGTPVQKWISFLKGTI